MTNNNGQHFIRMADDSFSTIQYDRNDAEDTEVTDYFVIAETLTRITFAGFGGSLYGLTLEKQQQVLDRQSSVALATLSKTTTKQIGPVRRMYPPIVSPHSKFYQRQNNLLGSIQSGSTNFALTWAISCMMFVSILESSRITSPTSKILISLGTVPYLGIGEEYSLFDGDLDSELRRVVFVAMSDYTIGGAVAGLAGAYARSGNPTQSFPQISHPVVHARRSRPSITWGVGAGIGFGIIAGTFQALSDIVTTYIQFR